MTEQDEISGLESIGRENIHGTICHKFLLKEDSTHKSLRFFSDSILCLGKSDEAWKKRIEWITSSQSYRNIHGINGELTEVEWNICPGFDTLQICDKVKDLLNRWGETRATFTGRIPFMSMFSDIFCGTRDNEQECLAHAEVVSLYASNFGTGQWSFIG